MMSHREDAMRALVMYVMLSLYASGAMAHEQDGVIVMDPDLENMYENEQRALALKTMNDAQDYGIIENLFYENEHIKIYNYTAYEVDSAQSKFLLGQSDQIGVQDFGLSFGYGIAFRVQDRHSIGYEYLSNFPYDRGQMIRIFWNYLF